MKRLWIGVVLLLILLGLGIGITVASAHVQGDIAQKLAQASQAALDEDWDAAKALSSQAKQDWERHRRYTAAIADHEPMEEIDSLFSQMEVYLRMRDRTAFSACCGSLEVLTRAVGEAQAINWWSLL